MVMMIARMKKLLSETVRLQKKHSYICANSLTFSVLSLSLFSTHTNAHISVSLRVSLTLSLLPLHSLSTPSLSLYHTHIHTHTHTFMLLLCPSVAVVWLSFFVATFNRKTAFFRFRQQLCCAQLHI